MQNAIHILSPLAQFCFWTFWLKLCWKWIRWWRMNFFDMNRVESELDGGGWRLGVRCRDGPTFAPACHRRLKLDAKFQPTEQSNSRIYRFVSTGFFGTVQLDHTKLPAFQDRTCHVFGNIWYFPNIVWKNIVLRNLEKCCI